MPKSLLLIQFQEDFEAVIPYNKEVIYMISISY